MVIMKVVEEKFLLGSGPYAMKTPDAVRSSRAFTEDMESDGLSNETHDRCC